MATLGIDLGSDTIKVVEMAKGRGGFALLNYAIVPTPPDAVVDGDVRDAEMLAEALKQALKQAKFKSKRAVASVQGQKSTVVRIIELPRMAKNELADSMKFEVERHIPFAASQIIMDYTVVQRPGEDPESPNMEVLFGAVQEDVVESLVEAFRLAKLKPKAIDAQPLALTRSLVGASPGGGLGETVAIVNIGAIVTDLSIIRDGLLHFPRAIPIAGRSVTQRLSEGLGISEQQAERLKRELADVTPLPPDAMPAVVEPEPEEVEEEAKPDLGGALSFGDEFESEVESDTGFGGSGTGGAASPGGFSFTDSDDEAEEAPSVFTGEEESDRQAFELSDEGDEEGPTFDFGLGGDDDDKKTSFSLSPADDETDEDAPVPESEGFHFTDAGDESFKLDEDQKAEAPAFEFEFTDDTEATDADAQAAPEAVTETDQAESEEPGGFFELDPAVETAAPSAEPTTTTSEPKGMSFDDQTAEAETEDSDLEEETREPATEAVAGFAFDETEETAVTEAEAETAADEQAPAFSFSETEDEDTDTAVTEVTGETEAPVFDFDLGETDDSSSVPAATESSAAGVTDVGSSFDLGDLATDDSLDFDLGDLSDETQEGAPPAAAETRPVTEPRPVPLAADEGESVRQVVEPVIREIAGEIGRSLDYYRSRFEGSVVDRVMLVGGTARMAGLAEFLEEELGLPVDRGDPLANVTVSNSRLTDEDLHRDSPLLAVAVGLAMYDLA